MIRLPVQTLTSLMQEMESRIKAVKEDSSGLGVVLFQGAFMPDFAYRLSRQSTPLMQLLSRFYPDITASGILDRLADREFEILRVISVHFRNRPNFQRDITFRTGLPIPSCREAMTLSRRALRTTQRLCNWCNSRFQDRKLYEAGQASGGVASRSLSYKRSPSLAGGSPSNNQASETWRPMTESDLRLSNADPRGCCESPHPGALRRPRQRSGSLACEPRPSTQVCRMPPTKSLTYGGDGPPWQPTSQSVPRKRRASMLTGDLGADQYSYRSTQRWLPC